MIRVDIESVIMATGPIPSAIVLRERGEGDDSTTPKRSLSIKTGSFEAAALNTTAAPSTPDGKRPLTHDLLLNALESLGARVERVEINRVDQPIFFATVVLSAANEVKLDARPSDALALAARTNAPIYVEDDVMNRAGFVAEKPEESASQDEFEQFDAFVKTLSPEDF